MRKVSKFWRIMLTIFVIALAFGTLFSCDDKKTSDNDQKGKMEGRVPVYQGMTIDNENPNINKVSSTNFDFRIAPLAYKGSEIVYVSATDVPNNPHEHADPSNPPGHAKGDIKGQTNQEVDEEQPFGEETATVEEKAKSTLIVQGAGETIYYAVPNQDIYVTVKLSNPDNYEIMSFTLNGNKYSSYMFEAGSDMENLILKVNVGDVAGIVEYTIDAVKYIDGTEIKDVIMVETRR